MKSYTVNVEQVQVNSFHLQARKITLNIDGKVVTLAEAPSEKYRCSRLKFIPGEGNSGTIQMQTDGLKIIFSRDRETVDAVSLFRSHVDQVCGNSSEQSQKKRHSSATFDLIRSPAPKRRLMSSSSRTRPGDSPGMHNTYERQIVSSVNKASPSNTTSPVPSIIRATHNSSRKKHNSLFGSPVPVNNKHSHSSNVSYSDSDADFISTINSDRCNQSHDRTPSKHKCDSQASGTKLRSDASPSSKKRSTDMEWAKLFGSNTSRTKSSALANALGPSKLPLYNMNKRSTPVKRYSTTTFTNTAEDNLYITPPQKNLAKTAFSSSPLENLFSENGQASDRNRSNNLFDSFSSASSSRDLGGIKNLGNTCFIGGVLQAMFCLENFKKDLLSPFWTSVIKDASIFSEADNQMPSCVTEFSKFLRNAHMKQSTPLDVLKFKNSVTSSLGKYKGCAQHDAHEFLCDFLNLVEEDLNHGLDSLLSKYGVMLADKFSSDGREKEDQVSPLREGLNNTSALTTTPATATALPCSVTAKVKNAVGNRPVGHEVKSSVSDTSRPTLHSVLNPSTRCFSSTVNATLTCTSCGEERQIQEQYRDFALEIDTSVAAAESVTLHDLFSSFFAKETRDLQCEHCKNANAKVDVKTSIIELPDVLCIQLKRFQYDNIHHNYEKISKQVSFPSLLNMQDFCSDEKRTNEAADPRAEVFLSRNSILSKDYSALLASPFVEERKHKPDLHAMRSMEGQSGLSHESTSSRVDSPATMESGEGDALKNDMVFDMTSPESGWVCESCTFANHKVSLPLHSDFEQVEVCEMCNQSRYSTAEEELADGKEQVDQAEDDFMDIDPASIPFSYELVAVLRHVGANPSSGHYTCDVKRFQQQEQEQQGHEQQEVAEKKWQHCDDSVLTSTTQKNVLRGQNDPYILFYQKC